MNLNSWACMPISIHKKGSKVFSTMQNRLALEQILANTAEMWQKLVSILLQQHRTVHVKAIGQTHAGLACFRCFLLAIHTPTLV